MNQAKKLLAILSAVVMLVACLPMSALAATYDETVDDYYKIITKDDYELAPGVSESEIVLNNEKGDRRQVLHVVEADVSNPYVKVIPSSKGMTPTADKYGVQVMSEQAAYAEANGYGNVVAAMNISLSWYDSAYYKSHPELVGEPLGYLVLDGQMYTNSQGQSSGAQTCLVINFDEKDGETRPADMPKTQIRSTKDPITGWEEQVIPANFGFLVKDGKAVNTSVNHSAAGASRSMLGIKEDGTVVIVMNDGRQSPYSEGLNDYEMSQTMLGLGCKWAINGDGGGSSTFLSQRPGEDLELNCSPSDGAERPTTHGVLVISSAPATGEFVRATISSESDYYTPGYAVQFSAIGSDLVGTSAEVPAEAKWQLADTSFGTIDQNGLFVSNGKKGAVTVQMVYNDAVVGSDTINIVDPDALSVGLSSITAPYGRDIKLQVSALYNSKNVVFEDGAVTLSLSDAAMGTINGDVFTATTNESVKEGSLIATYGTLTHTVPVIFGKGSEVLFDFEGYDVPELHNNKNYDAAIQGELSYVTRETGQVKSGNGAMAFKVDFTQTNSAGGWIYAGLNVNQEDDVVIPADAIRMGMWVYIPQEAVGLELDFRPWQNNGNGTYTRKDIIPFENGFATRFDESGWHYVSADISSMGELVLPGINSTRISEKQQRAAFEFYNPPNASTANQYDGSVGDAYRSINGTFTIYLDDLIIDYSTAVDDRELPTFPSVIASYGALDEGVALSGQTIDNNQVIFKTKPAEDTTKSNYSGLNYATAKAFVDGIDLTSRVTVGPDGTISLPELTLADGVHTVKFSIEDNMGNRGSIIRQVNIQAGSAMETIKVQPKNASLDLIPIGSLYYMDVVATAVENVKKVEVKIDLNNSSEWEPDAMEIADGFTATCDVDPIDEIATIVIEKTGKVSATGEAVLVSIPARTWESTRHLYIDGMTPEKIWANHTVWAQDMQFTVTYGKLTCQNGNENTFSAQKHKVTTELSKGDKTADADYWNSRTTWHQHDAQPLDDLAPTCTKTGYTGRTYCAGCASIVEVGTIVDPTGHTFAPVGNVLTCDCGETYTENGLVTIDGKGYYVAGGKLVGNWVELSDGWYYFDTTTYASVDTLNNGYVTFEFYENGKVVSGQWHHTSSGSRYYYGSGYYRGSTGASRWIEIDGKQYCFDYYGYCAKGITFIDDSYDAVYTWYDFGEDGAMVRKLTDLTGPQWLNGKLYYPVKGVNTQGLRKIDGAYYYFASADYFCAVSNLTRSCQILNDSGLKAGTYTFGADGKMVDNAYYTVNDVLYYFVLGNISAQAGTTTIDGKEYTIDETGKVHYTGYLTDASGEKRYYEDGVVGVEKFTGIRDDYYYIDGVKVKAYYGLVKYEGYFYYVDAGAKILKNTRKYINTDNGLTLDDGTPVGKEYYYFDDEGKMFLGNEILNVDKADKIQAGGTARMETGGTTLGLAFRFFADVTGATKDKKNNADYSKAEIDALGRHVKYTLVGVGAVMTNKEAYGTDASYFTLDNVDGSRLLDIPAEHLIEAEADYITFAVRITNIPTNKASTVIYTRAYYIFENAKGERVVVYDDIQSASYE